VKREFSVPAIIPAPTSGSLADAIVENAAQAPHRVALSVHRGGAWVGVTSQQFLDEVKAVAKGIIASGVEPGQRIAIMSRTRYDWTVADYAIWYAGGTVVPVYETSSAEQVQWILGDSNAVGVFLESSKNKAVFDEVAGELPDCTRTWIFDDGALETLTTAGAGISDEELEARRATLNPESLATIIYTSGTTGPPKGVMLSHSNIAWTLESVGQSMREQTDIADFAGKKHVSYLPMAHIAERMVSHYMLLGAGIEVSTCPETSMLTAFLGEVHPNIVFGVPRVWEKLYGGVTAALAADPEKAEKFNADKDSVQKKCNYTWNFNFDFNNLKTFIKTQEEERKAVEERNRLMQESIAAKAKKEAE